ncbi:MAG TPA: FAD-binding protein [Armatimonadetes bacterium]|nr:FAD-binding protein [Armatimonadota bacterium]
MARKRRYEVIIVGAGPAGIFAALELAEKSDLRVLLLDKGADLEARLQGPTDRPRRNALLCGWGGSGAFSDGKLTFSREVGGWLGDFLPGSELEALLADVDRIYCKFGAPERVYGTDEKVLADLERRAARAGLKLLPTRIRHLGTETCREIVARMRDALVERVDVRMNTTATAVLTENDRVEGVETAEAGSFAADYVILAPGREGAKWLQQEAHRLGLRTTANPVDLGVRVEVPAAVLEELTSAVYEPKLIYYSRSFDDQVRTFCLCPYGEVIVEYSEGIATVNGHSYAHRRTNNTNFALLVSTSFTEPFKEPIAYGQYIARLANILGGSVIVQRLGDLQAGRRSTPERLARGVVEPTLKEATPGDLSFVLPYRHLCSLREMLEALDRLAPGVNARDTLLYGVEVKFYSSRLDLTPRLETDIRNLFTIGDGAGVTRGLAQASASGLMAAREILRRTQAA